MAEEKKVLVDIEINSEDIKKARDAMSSSAKEAALLTLELNKLKEEQKKNNAEAKAGAISATELASRQAGLKLQMTETSKALAASNKDYVNNKIVVDAAKGSNDQLKARLSLLTKEYNAMSEEQKVNTESGKQLGATVEALSSKLKVNEGAVGNNTRNVGNYTESIKEAYRQMEIEKETLQELNNELKKSSETVEEGSKDWVIYNKEIAKNEVSINKLSQSMGEVDDEIESTKAITNALSLDFKSLAEQSANAGGANKLLSTTFTGVVSGLKSATIASLKFIMTPIGAVIAGIALAVGTVVGVFKLFSESLNRTEDGAAALSGVMNVFKGIMSGVLKTVEPIALFLVEGLANGFEKLGEVVETVSKGIEKALRFIGMEAAANGLNTITTNIEETSSATAKLGKAEAELNKIKREQGKIQLEFQNRAEKQRQIRDDESKSIKERMQANRDLGVVLTEQSSVETALAQRSLEIANLRIKAEGDSSENLDRKAEAELKLLEIEERINSQRSEQMTNENSLIRDGVALAKEANATRIAILKEKEEATKEEEEATKEAAAALIKSFEDQRALIDEAAELEKNTAIISIESAEERAEKIAFIEREALQAKLMSIDDETAAYTASADMVGAVDEEKYAKQLALRAKFEAELAEANTAARAQEFNDKIAALSLDEQLEMEAAEFSIDNERDLAARKGQIALGYLTQKLELMRAQAEADDLLTENEIKNLQLVENEIKRIQGGIQENLDNPDAPNVADMLGLTDNEFERMNAGLELASQAIQTLQGILTSAANVRLDEIDFQSSREIQAIEESEASEESKAAQIKSIESKAAQDKYKIELEQFKTSKALSITLAIISTAQAIIAQMGNPVPFAGIGLSILAGLTGAAQVAIIASSKPPSPPKFARGGYVSGAGTDTSDSIDAKLSTGESVNNARTTKMFGREISAMNAAGGGVDWFKNTNASGNRFAQGGIVSPTFAARQTTQVAGLSRNDLAEVIAQMPAPIVTVSDINRVQGQVATVSQSADL